MSERIFYNWEERLVLLLLWAVVIASRTMNWLSPETYSVPPAGIYVFGALVMGGMTLLTNGRKKYIVERWLYGVDSLVCLALALTSTGPIFL